MLRFLGIQIMKQLVIIGLLTSTFASFSQEGFFYARADSFVDLFHQLEPLVEPEILMLEHVVEKLSTLTIDYTPEEVELMANLMNLAYVRLAYAHNDFRLFLRHSSFIPHEEYLLCLYSHKIRVKKIIDNFEYRAECAFCRYTALIMPSQEDKNRGCRKCFKEDR